MKISVETVITKIYIIRDKKVMLDKDLAELYDVTTGNLNKAVGRNLKRFPKDFMFELTKVEFEELKSHISTTTWGGTRKPPKVFTEQGVAMLSGVLHSDRAIMVNIQIMRAYSKMRTLLTSDLNVKLEIENIKKKLVNHSKNIELVFNYLDELIDKKENNSTRKRIGYK